MSNQVGRTTRSLFKPLRYDELLPETAEASHLRRFPAPVPPRRARVGALGKSLRGNRQPLVCQATQSAISSTLPGHPGPLDISARIPCQVGQSTIEQFAGKPAASPRTEIGNRREEGRHPPGPGRFDLHSSRCPPQPVGPKSQVQIPKSPI